MRRRNGFRAAALTALVAGPAAGQDGPRTTVWPLRKIDFPVPVSTLGSGGKRPAKLKFWAAPQDGRFDLVSEKAPDQLDVLSAARNQRGFSYTTDRDGVYDFAVQFVFADGKTEPAEADLRPEWRVTFDTKPPVLTVRQAEPTRLEWDAADDHLAAAPIVVETRWPGGGKWKPVERKFPAIGGYTWTGLKENDPLEVRVIARDKAGLESVSRTFTLPGRGDGGRLPSPGLDDPPPRQDSSRGFGNPPADDGPGQPPTEYVNRRELTVQSRLSRVTRSGVRKAYLWVNDGKLGWKLHHADDKAIPGNATDQAIEMGYTAPADGLYGFLVIPESAAGTKQPDPVAGTPPQYYVYVDTRPPEVQVSRAEAAAGGAAGPRVTVEWRVTEAGSGLMPDSIFLEYSPAKAGPWTAITDRKVENTGRYTWEVTDKALWQCFIRVSATDKAGNTGSHVFDKEVFLDLERPAAVIEKVTGGGGGEQSRRADPVPQPPAVPTSSPAPSTVPTGTPPGSPALPPLGPAIPTPTLPK
jgi:hypothetical protein